MLDYTKMAMKQALDDFKKAFFVLRVATQAVYIAYLVYALVSMRGLLLVNAILLALSTGYLLFYLFATAWGKSPDGKKMKQHVSRSSKQRKNRKNQQHEKMINL